MHQADVVIVGGGIVGLATAWQLASLRPDLSITILEKEDRVAAHQTGRNSGVLHSGVYYRPGSLKAKNCVAGRAAMEFFCENEGIPSERCGKVIVAANNDEAAKLVDLARRGEKNGVRCQIIDRAELLELEPWVHGIKALRVPDAGIVDYSAVCRRLEEKLKAAGHILEMCALVTAYSGDNDSVIETTAGVFRAKRIITCAGLHADRVARLFGDTPGMQIVPFRGEYFALQGAARRYCRNLIYPVPDSRFPFLGVHFTRRTNGEVECGPNAVLAMAREGYRKTDFNLKDLCESAGYSGFRRLSRKYWRVGVREYHRSFSKTAFLRTLQRLIPAINAADLGPAPSGVRAQALGPDGSLLDDYIFESSGNRLHVLNAPSPAATSALQIGKVVAEKALQLPERG